MRASGQPKPRPWRLPAGALMLVLTIGIVVAGLVLTLVVISASRRTLVRRDAVRLEVRRNAYSGLAYLQASSGWSEYAPHTLDLFGTGFDSVLLEKRPWGLFDIALVQAFKAGQRDSLQALLGAQLHGVGRLALYLPQDRAPLSVGGGQVVGDCYIPAGEVRAVAGVTFRHPTPELLVNGTKHPSPDKLSLNADSSLARLFSLAAGNLQEWLPLKVAVVGRLRAAKRSFSAIPLVWYRSGPLEVQQEQLTGNVIVASGRRVVVGRGARLDHAIIVAPVVVLQAGFTGRVQVFARDSVLVEKRCRLVYPSAVCALAQTQPAYVSLSDSSQLDGIVLAAGARQHAAETRVVMTPAVTVRGQVFSTGTVENCGQIMGNVMARRLLHRNASTFYENYLVDATIDRKHLPLAWLSTRYLNLNGASGVVAWLP